MAATARYERKLLKDYDYVVGVDEVGRGCLAGPVVVCAFVFDKSSTAHRGVDDSKRLTRNQRSHIRKKLVIYPHAIGIASAREIEEINISNAVSAAIHRALKYINTSGAGKLLLDGRIYGTFPFDCEQIIDGDAKHYSIAAASILAKEFRDRLMLTYANEFPHYKFDSNVGYATKEHRDALKRHGVTVWHRKTYVTVREALEEGRLA